MPLRCCGRTSFTRRSLVPVGRSGRAGFLGLGLVGLLLTGGRGVAQTPSAAPSPNPLRMTVRPHEMATGTQNQRGLSLLEFGSFKNWFVYVPWQCEGTRRCPLLVYAQPDVAISYLLPSAEKYGMIVLATGGSDDAESVDSALKLVLPQYAIDPDKIALAGFSRNGTTAFETGYNNQDVFSRILALSAGGGNYELNPPVGPKNTATEFFISAGILEGAEFGKASVAARALRDEGHPVKLVLGFRNHYYTTEDFNLIGHWLRESWATPTPAARKAPRAFPADAVPLLTSKALAQMTTFWTRFLQEPDSIRTTAREAYIKEVTVPVGQERPSTLMMDIAELAATYPSVAADLQAAGLTAQKAYAYRVALLCAKSVAAAASRAALRVGYEENKGWGPETPLATISEWVKVRAKATVLTTPGAGPVLKKNTAFVLEHADELKVFDPDPVTTKGMWTTP